MANRSPTEKTLLVENAELRVRLDEAEETLRAIRSGEIDALVVQSQTGPQIYTLQGLDAELNRFRGEILERISEAIIVLDDTRRVVYLNAAAEQLYGMKAMAVLGYPVNKLYQNQWLHPDDEAAMIACLHEKGCWRGEAIHKKNNGDSLHVELLVTRLPESGNLRFGDVLVIRDITLRKQIEEAFYANERKFRAIFNHQYQYSALLDPEGRIVEISDSIITGTGIYPVDVIGELFLEGPWWKNLPESRAQLRRQFEDALARPGPARGEADYQTTDGLLRHALNTVTALRDPQGEVEYLLVEGLDITERKEIEAALRDSERHFRDIVKSLP